MSPLAGTKHTYVCQACHNYWLLSNIALLLPGILANSELQTFSRLIHRSSSCSFVIGCLWTIGLAFPLCAFFLQMALRTLFAVSNTGSPTMDHDLFIGGCLRYRSTAAQIVRRDETFKSFPSFCFTAAWKTSRQSFSSSFFSSSIGVSNLVWLENHSVKDSYFSLSKRRYK